MSQSVTWCVQTNLSGESFDKISQACQELGNNCVGFKIIPFLDKMPRIGVKGPFVLIGSTTMNRASVKSRKYSQGIFFNPKKFRPTEYARHYGADYFNHDLRVTSLKELDESDYDLNTELFIRVNDDSKQVSGGTVFFSDLLNLKSSTEEHWVGGDIFTPDTEICIASVKPIDAEWRLVIVSGRVVAASRYRPTISADVPREVIDFGNRMAYRWTPHDVCVMDVCASEDQLYVLECNCFNGSGFYAADLKSIITAVSEYQASRA